MSKVGIGRYEVDCNTPNGVGCMTGELDNLAATFNGLCDDQNGAASDFTPSEHM